MVMKRKTRQPPPEGWKVDVLKLVNALLDAHFMARDGKAERGEST